MLDYITVKGFRSIKSIEKLELGPLTLLIGANGSGKSNFVGVFSFLNALREGRLKEYVLRAGGAENVLHYGSRVTEHLEIHISIGGGQAKYCIKLVPTGADELVLLSEFIDAENFGRGPIRSAGNEAGIRREVQTSVPMRAHVEALFDGRRIYHFHDTGDHSPMKKTADVHDNRYLRSDGSNLAAFLYLLRERHRDDYDTVVQVIQQAAPFFKDFDLRPENLNPHKIRLQWRHTGTDAFFDASSLSDGTLRFIALATVFLQPEEYRPAVILVDEPELGLHPYAIALLASLMQQASTETQVVVSTQSSLLLDHFEPEDVIVAERAGGATTLERLDSPRLKTWLEDYSLGQLWEKNELGGRPVPE